MKAKERILFILHTSPPLHGAAKVGDFIAGMPFAKANIESSFVTITSSKSIEDIGKFSSAKIVRLADLFFRIIYELVVFRPNKIYFTPSVQGLAFCRDIILCILWKLYGLLVPVECFYHYHTRGISRFYSRSWFNRAAVDWFLRDSTVLCLGPNVGKEFDRMTSIKKIEYLPNGVETPPKFEEESVAEANGSFNVLYLSNMIPSKGYFDVLKLSESYKACDVIFHFAGSWQDEADREEFFRFIERRNLKKNVVYHGFADEKLKLKLFHLADLFMFPTQYAFEAFPLSILESLSHGVPVVSTRIGEIPSIIGDDCGIIIDDISELGDAFDKARNNLCNSDVSAKCRSRFSDNFSLRSFEERLMSILDK